MGRPDNRSDFSASRRRSTPLRVQIITTRRERNRLEDEGFLLMKVREAIEVSQSMWL
jgi:hypothetical protein